MKASNLLICLFILYSSSCITKQEEIKRKLVGETGTKYWDFKHLGESIPSSEEEKLSYRCMLVKGSGKVVHLSYLDSLRVEAEDCHSDVITNPDNFILKGDSIINFLGLDYTIHSLTENKMILSHIADDNKTRYRIYVKSKYQNLKIEECKYN